LAPGFNRVVSKTARLSQPFQRFFSGLPPLANTSDRRFTRPGLFCRRAGRVAPATQLESYAPRGSEQLISEASVIHRSRDNHPADTKGRNSLSGLMTIAAVASPTVLAHAEFQQIDHGLKHLLECALDWWAAAGHIARQCGHRA